MSSNISSVMDQFEEHPDWIELYNSGPDTLDLGSFRLSDDPVNRMKWSLPGYNLPPEGYTLIFASGRDLSIAPVVWYTVVDIGEEWHYLLPGETLPDLWKTSETFTEGWSIGKSGIGYGDDDDSTIIAATASVYMQKTFEIADTDQISAATLYMDYDDGFVAYLNGVEIARSSNMGVAGSTVPFDQFADALHEASMINGQPLETFSLDAHTDLFRKGTNILAVEVHNVSLTSSDLTSIPLLVLGASEYIPGLPRGNRYVLLTDQFPHANFRIKSSGEPLYLSDSLGITKDSMSMVEIPSDFSFGRNPSFSDSFVYFESPTPGAVNDTVFSATYFSDSVRFIIDGNDFDPFQRVAMSTDRPKDTIYYTLDGSNPVRTSLVYRGYLNITETTILKARIYRSGNLPGPVTTKTLFTGEGHELPVASISMNPEDLWNDQTGIYVLGPNAQTKFPYFGANFWQDWERPVNIELYDENHDLVLNQQAGTKIFGAFSRGQAQKSMAFFARGIYGDGSFSAKLFSEKEIDSFEAFVFRNSGNDWCNGIFRDAFIESIANEMDLDHQAYNPYVIYLNGVYWGILNMREKVNEHFLESNRHVYADHVNLLGGNATLIHGSRDKYDQLLNFVRNNSFESDAKVEQLGNMMDIDNFIRYWVLNVYMDNKDWPGNNIKYWSTTAEGSLFKWIAYDTDFGLSIWDNTAYQINTLLFSFGEGDIFNHANKDWALEIIQALIQNEHFCHKLINEFADRMNYTFLTSRTIPVIDSFQQRIFSEVPDHLARWEKSSLQSWLNSVERMRIFLRQRPEYVRAQMMERFNIASERSLLVEVYPEGSGTVRINSIVPDTYPFNGIYFDGIPVELEALAAPGFRFIGWTGNGEFPERVIGCDMTGDASYTAMFVEVPNAEKDIVINEINYYASETYFSEDWIELYNNASIAVDLEGWVLKDAGSEEGYVFLAPALLQPGDYYVVCKNRKDFRTVYPELSPIAGDFSFGLDREGDGLALCEPNGTIRDFVNYQTVTPWPLEPNGTGATLELKHPSLDNASVESWGASSVKGTPGKLNSVYQIPDAIQHDLSAKTSFNIYPVPFSEKLWIELNLARATHTIVKVYTLTGKVVDVVDDRDFDPGKHRLVWSPGKGTPGGIYIVNVTTGSSHHSYKAIYQTR